MVPDDERAAAAAGHDHLWASRADRERVIQALKVSFARGRLSKAEFDLRMSRTLASRTYADLAALRQAGTAARPAPPQQWIASRAKQPAGTGWPVPPGRRVTAIADSLDARHPWFGN
jgi:hypothetical protein